MNNQDIYKDPGKYFDSPQAVLDNSSLSDVEKKKILNAWKVIAKTRSVAADEGMLLEKGPSLFEKIVRALNSIE